MKFRYVVPLLLFLIPTAICSALMWPAEAAQPHLIGGYAVMLLSVVSTYFTGVNMAINDKPKETIRV